MASATVAIPGSERKAIALGWIINQRDDLVWFIGSVVSSYIFLAANVKLGLPVMLLVWIWALGFDGPHVYGTVSRTYADSEVRRERARLLYGTLTLFLLGPAMVLAGYAHLFGTNVWGPIFFFFASLWAYYHLVKQHYGFMILYKKKNNDLEEFDNTLDRAVLLLGFTYPLLVFITGAAAKRVVPFATNVGPYHWLQMLVLSAFIVSLVIFAGRQIQRAITHKPIDAPKLLLMGAAVPMHWIVLFILKDQPEGLLAAVATLTIYHNIQYHRIIWFHNKNKYGRSEEKKYGLASIVNKNVWRYIVVAGLFGAAYHIPHYTIIAKEPYGLAMAFFWGGAFSHYYLDSKIWRVRRDKQLGANLKMGDGAQRPAVAG